MKVQKMVFGFLAVLIFLFSGCDGTIGGNENNVDNGTSDGEAALIDNRTFKRGYEFSNGIISRDTLVSYLSRSITIGEFLANSSYFIDGGYPYRDDDTRMIKNIGAKFIGRAIGNWNRFGWIAKPDYFAYAAQKAAEMHQYDPDIVFQAAIFEIVTPGVNSIPVPAWVFEAFGLPVQTRNFSYKDMLNKNGKYVNNWGTDQSIPDISCIETRMFFYFLAKKYMESGIEAIHFGQVELMAMSDKYKKYAGWRDLLSKVRAAAKVTARRGTVICDGHSPSYGIVVDGKLLHGYAVDSTTPHI